MPEAVAVERRLAVAGAAVVGVAFGMGRFAFGLTLPDLRTDPTLAAGAVPDAVLGLIAGGTFAGFLAGIVAAPLLAARRGPRAPTTVGGVCGAVGALTVALAPSVGVLAVGAVLAGSAAGWVWAPYSDLAAALARAATRPRLLSVISTGTCGGLVVVGAVALAVGGAGWRAVWAAVALCSVAAAVVNRALVPAVAAPGRRASGGGRLAARVLAGPAGFAVVYQAATALGFTYAAETVRRAGADVGPWLFVIIGVLGSAAFATGAMSRRLGVRRVAAGCLLVVGTALVLLALAGDSVPLALLAAAVFAPGYMTGAAALAVWTTEVAPDDPGRALSAAMVVGACGAILAPVVVGTLTTTVGLPALLGVSGAAGALVGVRFALVST